MQRQLPRVAVTTSCGSSRHRLEEGLVGVAEGVLVQARAGAFRVTHLAEHAAVGLVMPSMASTDPLGFTAKSMEGCPAASTY